MVGAGILLTKIDRFDFLIFFFEISVTQKSRRQELIGTETFRFQLVQFGFGYDRTNWANRLHEKEIGKKTLDSTGPPLLAPGWCCSSLEPRHIFTMPHRKLQCIGRVGRRAAAVPWPRASSSHYRALAPRRLLSLRHRRGPACRSTSPLCRWPATASAAPLHAVAGSRGVRLHLGTRKGGGGWESRSIWQPGWGRN